MLSPGGAGEAFSHDSSGPIFGQQIRSWKVERFFAWLFNFRRLATRWEHHAHNFDGFLALASVVIILRHL